MAKLRAEIEAGQPQPDVLLIADVVTMEGLKNEGRLMAYPEADISAYDAGLMDKDKTYFSTKLITTGIVYNTKAPFVPASWTDLAKPEAKGLVAMPSPLTSGAAMIHTVTLTGNLPRGLGLLRCACQERRAGRRRQWRRPQGRVAAATSCSA